VRGGCGEGGGCAARGGERRRAGGGPRLTRARGARAASEGMRLCDACEAAGGVAPAN
jgi:hypothetical protein